MREFLAIFCLLMLVSFLPDSFYHFDHHKPGSLSRSDKAPAPSTKYTDDIDTFVTYDVAPKDRPAALLGAQRAMTWMENHGALDYYPPSEGESP